MSRVKLAFFRGGSIDGPKTWHGFSIVEVLIALFVLVVGVVGTSGMLLASLRTAQQSAIQATALQLASDMAEAIRAHMSHPAHRVAAFPLIEYRSSSPSSTEAPSSSCYRNTCDVDAQIEFELYEWKQRIASALPGGRAIICYDAEPWSAAKQQLNWECNGAARSGAPLVIKLGWQAKGPDGSLVREGSDGFAPSVVLVVAPG